MEFFLDPPEQESFIVFYNFRKLKQLTRVRANAKFCQKCARQLLVSGRYSFMNLTCIREKENRSYIYYKKNRYPYISIKFSGISQEFRKLISY
jgi:hypothetical protein